MGVKPRLVQNILLRIGSLQGEVYNNSSEEEPGKIIHEYRKSVVNSKKIDDVSYQILTKLASVWGGTGDELAYYGSIDSTPHFIRTSFRYVNSNGDGILQKKLVLRSGKTIAYEEAVDRSFEWLIAKLESSKSGLLEYCRQNPNGIENQAWKDSKEFYIHKNGQLANHSRPIASIEVQCLVYDALFLYGTYKSNNRALEIATRLRDRVVQLYWLEKSRYFALGSDYSTRGRLRVFKTVTANPAALLDSHIFDGMTEEEKHKYIGGITETIMGDEFLTDAGIRSRALSEANLVSFWDYHGSYVTWPKETYDIAKGLRRHGFLRLSAQLENRLLNTIKLLRSYPEFIYVDGRGRVLGATHRLHEHGDVVLLDSSIQPEQIQAWTVSAIIAINASRRMKPIAFIRHYKKTQKWHNPLEAEIMRKIPHVSRLRTKSALIARYPSYPYNIRKNRE